MNELEVEEEDHGNPAIDGSIWLDVGVAEHTFDIACVNFHNKIADANEVKACGVECTKKPIELELHLRIMRLALGPQDGTKTQRAAAAIGAVLHENPPNTANGRVD